MSAKIPLPAQFEESKKPMIYITGMWKKKTKDGEDYIQGPWEDASFFIFLNKKKEKETQPDFHVFMAQGTPKYKRGRIAKAIKARKQG